MNLLKLDRRVIFLIILIGVTIPLLVKIGFNLEVTENSRTIYKLIEETPAGKAVIVSIDFDPSSQAELQPMAKAILEHAFRKKHKVILTALWPMGVIIGENAVSSLEDKYPVEYGKDYVNLGYKAGGMVTIQAMGRSFQNVYPKDINGSVLDSIPLMQNVKNFENIGYVVSLSAGSPGLKEWIMVANDKFNIPVAGGATAVSAPEMLPYLNKQQQLHGLLGGLKGAAEYEKLIGKVGLATAGMDAQSIAHLIIIAFIALGNINYYLEKKRKREGKK
jgi:hypothetical protein